MGRIIAVLALLGVVQQSFGYMDVAVPMAPLAGNLVAGRSAAVAVTRTGTNGKSVMAVTAGPSFSVLSKGTADISVYPGADGSADGAGTNVYLTDKNADTKSCAVTDKASVANITGSPTYQCARLSVPSTLKYSSNLTKYGATGTYKQAYIKRSSGSAVSTKPTRKGDLAGWTIISAGGNIDCASNQCAVGELDVLPVYVDGSDNILAMGQMTTNVITAGFATNMNMRILTCSVNTTPPACD